MRILHAIALSVLALATVLPAIGCGRGRSTATPEPKAPPWLAEKTAKPRDQSNPQQEAIMRVLEADQAHFKGGFDAMLPTSQPSAVKVMILSYVDHLEKVDMSGCPIEFIAAHNRHMKGWRLLHAAINRLPDAYQGEEFMNSLYSLFHENGKNGQSLGGDVIQTVKRVNSTYVELYTSAEGYGLSFETTK